MRNVVSYTSWDPTELSGQRRFGYLAREGILFVPLFGKLNRPIINYTCYIYTVDRVSVISKLPITSSKHCCPLHVRPSVCLSVYLLVSYSRLVFVYSQMGKQTGCSRPVYL